MNALISMLPKMKATGLYQMTGNTLVEAELAACAAGLDLIYEELARTERELFITTACEEGLDLRELAFGPKRDYLALEDRREMLLYRSAVTGNDFDRESIQRALKAIGLEAAIDEDPAGQTLYVNCIRVLDGTKTQKQVMQEAEDFLPAHLEVYFDFSILSWDFSDESNLTFEEMDSQDYTWDEIDLFFL